MLKAKSIKEPIINEIGFQIGNVLNQEENYKLLKNIEARSKHEQSLKKMKYKSWYTGQINETQETTQRISILFLGLAIIGCKKI